ARRQVDTARDDDLGDADGDDADLGLRQDHDLEAQRVHDEALPDEDPAEDLEQEHHADHDAEDAELGRQPAASGAGGFAGRGGGRNVGCHACGSLIVWLRRYCDASSMILTWVASLRSTMPVMRPSCMTRMRSLIPRTSGISDEIIITATPCPASSVMSLWISALAPTSMPRVGSSRMRMRGLVISQRAMSTFC